MGKSLGQTKIMDRQLFDVKGAKFRVTRYVFVFWVFCLEGFNIVMFHKHICEKWLVFMCIFIILNVF